MFAIVFNDSPLADSPRMKPATSRQPIDVTVGRQATGRCGGAGPRPQDARAFGPIPVSRSICPRTNIAMVGPGSEGADDDDDCDALVKIGDPFVDRCADACDRFVDPGVDNAPSSCDETDDAIRAASVACPWAASSNSIATRASLRDA